MKGTVHSFDVLANPPQEIPGGICVLFGKERFLKLLCIKNLVAKILGEEAEFGATTVAGHSAQWNDVIDEVTTLTLFGGDAPRIAIVDDGDEFVTRYRDKLEDYVKSPPSHGLLLLSVSKWPSNTKLYKAIAKSGLQIECDPPVVKRGRGKQRQDDKIAKWLVTWAQVQHGYELPVNAAYTIMELTDCEFGRMDQELAKLALYVDDNSEIDHELVKKVVGGWRTETMWSAIDAATDGDAATALKLLDQLLSSGQHPLALFGQLSWSLRRYAETAEIVARQQRQRIRIDMGTAMKEAGFNAWGGELDKGDRRMKQLGRERAFQIYQWLLEADSALKRTHTSADRARLVLERLFVQLSGELATANA